MITRRKVLGTAALAGAWLAGGTGAAIAAGSGTRSIAGELSEFVADRADRGLFSGTVLLDHRGRTVYSAAHGLAVRSAGIPNTVDTRFSTASVGKFFTGVTAARTVQDGLLTFDTRFGDAVGQLRNPALRPLTMHQLLTHTADLPAVANPQPVNDGSRAIDYLPLLEELELAGTPGRWRYSNAGYLAVALMIEQTRKRPFGTVVRTSVFNPAGMHQTHTHLPEGHGLPVAVRYTPSGEIIPPDRATGAGGFHTTVGDLVAFGHALLAHRLLDEEHTTEVTTGKVAGGKGDLYAYGCSVHNVGGHEIISHSGGAKGAGAYLQLYPGDGYTLATLSNVNDSGYEGGVGPIVRKAEELITGG